MNCIAGADPARKQSLESAIANFVLMQAWQCCKDEMALNGLDIRVCAKVLAVKSACCI